ncbi:Lrp/AsnC family transcriptional regulator [Halobacteriota archaeon]
MGKNISHRKNEDIEYWEPCCLDRLPIDDADTKIIKILMKNSRTSNVDIAKKVGISEGTVRHRIDQLKAKNIIRGFITLIDCEESDNCVKVFIRLKVDEARLKDVTDALKGHERVVALYRVNNEFNLLCECMFRSVIELQEFIDSRLHTDDILDSTVQMVTRSYKKCLWTGL